MSFFDEGDEPPEEPRPQPRAPRNRPRAAPRPPAGRPVRPPRGQSQQVQNRRLIAAGVIVAVVVVVALLVHQLQVSQANNSMKTYAGNVDGLMTASYNNGTRLFAELQRGNATNNESALTTAVTNILARARANLSTAEHYSPPSQMASAQRHLIDTLQLRYNGIQQIAAAIPNALTSQSASQGVADIAVGMYDLAASDVVYKSFVATGIATALNGAGITIGGTSGVPINSSQLMGDLSWLDTRAIAARLGAPVPSSQANLPCSGSCGHQLNSVSYGTTLFYTTITNTLPAGTRPTLTLSVTNTGTSVEYDVQCKVWIKGYNDSATSSIASTTPNQSTTCNVTLPRALPAGTSSTLHAEVVPVPGEADKTNNFLAYPVTFK